MIKTPQEAVFFYGFISKMEQNLPVIQSGAQPKIIPTKPAIPSRDYYYKRTAKYFNKAIKVWVKSLSSKNENIALGAANKIIDKILPDIKAVEVTGENGEPIKLNLITPESYLSAIRKLATSSEGSIVEGSGEIQGTNMAPESTQNNNSNQSNSSVEST